MSKELNDFVAQYYKGLADGVYGQPVCISKEDTVLVLIDVQESISKEYYIEFFKSVGMYSDALEPLLDELGTELDKTLSNIEKILKACREKGIRPIHVKIQAQLPDAMDTGRLHRSAGMLYPPGTHGTGFLPQAAPIDGEIVLTKTCSGAHVGTPIDRILRNLGTKKAIVAGFYTDQCVSTSVRDLSDLGYEVDLILDAVNAMSPERHEKALQGISKIYANSETTESLLKRLAEL